MLADDPFPTTTEITHLDTGPSDPTHPTTTEPETSPQDSIFDSAQFNLSQAALLGPPHPEPSEFTTLLANSQ